MKDNKEVEGGKVDWGIVRKGKYNYEGNFGKISI